MEKYIEDIVSAYFEKPKRLKTWSGFEVKEVYTPKDIEEMDYDTEVGNPGEYPFTRGIYPNMYRGRYWTRRLGWGVGTPADTNKQLHFLLKEGNTGLTIFRDLPTVLGIDPDHPLAEGEVGVAGVSLCSVEDMEIIMDGIPLDKVSMTILVASCAAPVILAQYIAAAEKQGVDPPKLGGTISNDSLHGYYAYGKEPNPIDLSLKLAVDVIEYCTQNIPMWNPISINSYDMRDAGLDAPQEIAVGLALAMAYIRGTLNRGLGIDDFAPRISFYCNAGMDFFEEIAKLRAMRRMWARLLREKFGARDPKSLRFRFAVHTAGSSLVPQQPLNNIIRIAYEQLVAVLSGVQSMNSCTFDEPICLPTEVSQRIALRNQQILAYETGVANVADPLGGSYYVEYLTNKIEEKAAKILQEIEDMGGITEAMRTKWIDREMERGSLQYQKEIESKERIIVGMNAFAIPPEEDIVPGGVLRTPGQTEEEQVAKVKRLRRKRDNQRVRKQLDKLREEARMGERKNLMPAIIQAVKAYATVEEIMGTIREAYGYGWDPFGMRKLSV